MGNNEQMSIQETTFSGERRDEIAPYRAVSKAAVLSLALAVLSFSVFLFAELIILPLAGLMFGITALRNIRRYPAELTGKLPAIFGTITCALCLFCGGAYHATVYATEVPDGFERISFSMLKAPLSSKRDFPPEEALQLDGKKIFVKGYIHPAVQGMGRIKTFVLVPDMGTCCFGGQPKLTHMVEVTMVNGERIQYSRRKRKLAGTLEVDSVLKPVTGLNGVYYQLKAEYAD
jgi:hypothetical protein